MTVAELIQELQKYPPNKEVTGDMATGNLIIGEDEGEIEL
jgi:hypothetical protein